MATDYIPALSMLEDDHSTLVALVRYLNHITPLLNNSGYVSVTDIQADDIADGAITDDKLSDAVALSISTAQATADGKNTVYYQTTEPTGGAYAEGDLWFDTDNDNKIYVYDVDTEAWIASELGTNAIASGAITAAKIATHTITANEMLAGTITAASGIIASLSTGTAEGERYDYGSESGAPYIRGYNSSNDLRVEYLYDRIKFYDAAGEVSETLAVTTDDITITVGSGDDYETIQEAVDALPKFIKHDVTINVDAGTYDEDVSLEGFLGTGFLKIAGSFTVKSINISGCLVSAPGGGSGGISIWGTSTGSPITISTTTASGLTVKASQYVYCRNISIAGASGLSGVWVGDGAFAELVDIVTSNRGTGVSVVTGATALLDTVTGSANTYGIHAWLGGRICKSTSDCPAGTSANEVAEKGGVIIGANGLTSGADGITGPVYGAEWTGASVVGSTVAGTGWSISVTANRYMRVGDMVFVTARIGITTKSGTATGNVLVTGLPIAADVVNYHLMCAEQNVTFTSGYTGLLAFTADDSTTLQIYQVDKSGSAATTLPISALASGSVLYISGWYKV